MIINIYINWEERKVYNEEEYLKKSQEGKSLPFYLVR